MAIIVTDKHFREWEHAAFGYGYGTGEAHILPILHAFFAQLEQGHSYEAAVFAAAVGAPSAWFLLNVLCAENILDYGTSPRYGWLTPLGERLRDYVLARTPEELYAIATQDFAPDEPLCSRNFCNCACGSDDQGCVYNPLWNETVPPAVVR
jgi:hypothetical protein